MQSPGLIFFWVVFHLASICVAQHVLKSTGAKNTKPNPLKPQQEGQCFMLAYVGATFHREAGRHREQVWIMASTFPKTHRKKWQRRPRHCPVHTRKMYTHCIKVCSVSRVLKVCTVVSCSAIDGICNILTLLRTIHFSIGCHNTPRHSFVVDFLKNKIFF